MKKTLIIVFTFFMAIPSFSQNAREEHHDKIKALKVALITEKLNLSTSEAQKFWPIYNTFENELERLQKSSHEKRNDINFESLSESDAQKLLDEMVALGNQRYDLYNKFIVDLKQVLPAKKIILLKKVEEEFKRKMLKEFQKRRKEKRNDRP